MIDEMIDELTNEDLVHRLYSLFKINIEIKAIIAENIPVSRSAKASVFLTSRQLLFCYIDSPIKLTLGDVKKIIKRMGLAPLQFIAPNANVDYFDQIALDKYNKIFPGMKKISEEDIYFYKTMVPYCPALVQISEVSTGVIKQYDSTAVGGWRSLVKFSYRRLQTS